MQWAFFIEHVQMNFFVMLRNVGPLKFHNKMSAGRTQSL